MKLRTSLKKEGGESHKANNGDDLGENLINCEVSHKHCGDTVPQSDECSDETLRHNLLLRCIGTIVSPYTKRMGTPRQGALVPSGRGFIQLRIPVECVEGLEFYSHAWILFTFHANTDAPTPNNNKLNGGETTIMNLSKTKIRPPRGNGIKVGMLATRSPHRPNNVGLSLVKVVGVDKKEKRLHIAALDLVNGTPVYGM